MNDKMKMPDVDGISMLMDTSVCISIYLMGKLCSNSEIKTFCDDIIRDRLIEQEFNQDEVDKFVKITKETILIIKKDFDNKETDNGDKI